MITPCANQACPNVAKSKRGTTLCNSCFKSWINSALPMGGYVPQPALTQIAKELREHIAPTPSEITEVIKFSRGTRHREGDWKSRPIYSFNVVAAIPRIAPSRRLPHILVGRRKPPTEITVLAAFAHYWIGRHHLDGFSEYCRYLAGSTFMGRRRLIRPVGEVGSINGVTTKHNYLLRSGDLAVVGTHTLKAAKMLGCNEDHGRWATIRYLRGVEVGEFNRPCIVPPGVMRTTGAGDSPFDHVLSCPLPHAPQWQRGLRRHTGTIRGRYPDNLDVPLDERPNLNQLRWQAQQIKHGPAPDTDWLFGDT